MLMKKTRCWAASGLCLFALLLSGCAAEPDTAETVDQLTAVTEPPAPSELDDDLDASLNPDPIVEPLRCSPYLVLTARGTGEPSEGQLLSPIVRDIVDSRPGLVQALDIDYPADDDVKHGSTLGARLLIDTMNVQTERCGAQRFILLGYSQGALVIGDALVPPEQRLVGETVGELTPEAADRVLTIVLFGNPRFTSSEPFNVGSFHPDLSGILPRPPGSLEAYSDRMRDYCVRGDFVCQSSLDLDPELHQSYYHNGMQQDAAAYVITQLDPLFPVTTTQQP